MPSRVTPDLRAAQKASGVGSMRPNAKVVIAGAGHAALVALNALARLPAAADVTLVSPGPVARYSGMVPGWIEGVYAAADFAVPLAPFARRVGISFIDGEATGADAGSLNLADGRRVPFDVLVLNTGADSARPGALASPHVVAAKPFGALVADLPARLRSARAFAVVGAGVAGIEVALALRARRPDAPVALIERGAVLLPEMHSRFVSRVRRRLAGCGVHLLLGAEVIDVGVDHVSLAGGATIPSDLTLALAGVRPPSWLAATPFAKASDGFVAVDDRLRSLSHPNVLAVGDIATRPDDPRPKAGVFSVRSGKPLAQAIRALSAGETPDDVTLQRRWLVLLSVGDRRAIATRNGMVAEGGWVWRWKDSIDRQFVGGFRQL